MPSAFSAYPHRSHGRETDGDVRPGGQTLMTTMRDEHASVFGNHPDYMAQNRHLGYDQSPWLSTNQSTAQQGSFSGVQNSFSPTGSSFPNVSHFTAAHNQGDTDDVWAAKPLNGASHEHHYPGQESFPDATQGYGQNFYPSSEGQLYKIDEYEGHHVSRRDTGDN